ncbi:iron-containing redox enzyme family protein [Streptomyces heilongjiangensis]|uniref:Iron-containing redox enzyme family protein n=1 Tax=Streptomyces heilongjiangensis TaxID=945052 RepID=A0ABW1BFS1_9ACTN
MSTGAHLLDQKTGVEVYPVVEEISSLLNRSAQDLDASLTTGERADLRKAVSELNAQSTAGDQGAFYGQQLLLSRIYGLSTQLPEAPTAEGSVVVQEVLRLLEQATMATEDAMLEPGILDAAPTEPSPFLSWLKKLAREHRVYKHPYYREFIRHQATEDDLRNYVIQESVVDGRFDDLLAMMQVGTSGAAKMEIAENFWDEMGNGDPSQVHTHLFNQIFRVFDIPADELERSLTANALLSGNLAVLLCRYRQLYPEAVGFLGMTEWLAPDRFVQVVHAWERLGLPDVGIVYHKLHITIDSRHAAGWFHNVVVPAAESERMRRAIARGTLWRLNSSARYLDERMPDLAAH